MTNGSPGENIIPSGTYNSYGPGTCPTEVQPVLYSPSLSPFMFTAGMIFMHTPLTATVFPYRPPPSALQGWRVGYGTTPAESKAEQGLTVMVKANAHRGALTSAFHLTLCFIFLWLYWGLLGK